MRAVQHFSRRRRWPRSTRRRRRRWLWCSRPVDEGAGSVGGVRRRTVGAGAACAGAHPGGARRWPSGPRCKCVARAGPRFARAGRGCRRARRPLARRCALSGASRHLARPDRSVRPRAISWRRAPARPSSGEMLHLSSFPRALAQLARLVEGVLGLLLLLLGAGDSCSIVPPATARRHGAGRRAGRRPLQRAGQSHGHRRLAGRRGARARSGHRRRILPSRPSARGWDGGWDRSPQRTIAFLALLPTWLADADAKLGLDASATRLCLDAIGDAPPRALAFVTTDDLSAGLLYEQTVAGLRPDVTVLVRQLLPERAETARRLQRGDSVVPPKRFTGGERDLERALITAELTRRHVLWEPGKRRAPPVRRSLDAGCAAVRARSQRARSRSIDVGRSTRAAQPLVGPIRAPRRRRALGAAGQQRYSVVATKSAARTLFETALGLHADDAPAEVDLAVLDARHGESLPRRWSGPSACCPAIPTAPSRASTLPRYQLALGDGSTGAAADFQHATILLPDEQAPWVGLGRVSWRVVIATPRDAI